MPTNTRSVIIENIVQFLGFLRGKFLGCHKVPSKTSNSLFVKAAVSHSFRTITPRDDRALLRVMRRIISVQDQGGTDQANWTMCPSPHGPKTFSSSYILLEISIPVPQASSRSSPLPPHVGRQATKLGLSALISCDIFDDEPMVSFHYCDYRAHEFYLCFGCSNPLAFQQHDKIIRTRTLQLKRLTLDS